MFLTAGEIIIKEGPSSLTIPLNDVTTAKFSCKALCKNYKCTSYWIIKEPSTKNTVLNDPLPDYVHNATILKSNETSAGYLYKLTLSINVSNAEPVNNTEITCRFSHVGDHNETSVIVPPAAYLMVISSKLLNGCVCMTYSIFSLVLHQLIKPHRYPPNLSLKATPPISLCCGLLLFFGLDTEYNTTTSRLPIKVMKVVSIRQ